MKRKPPAATAKEASPSPATKSPRPRKRKGRPRNHDVRTDRRGVIALSDGPPTYVPRDVSGFAPRVRGAKIRNSKRWIDCKAQPLTGLSFPFFDKLGKYTGTTLFKWSCDPRSFVASAVSTVASRLINRCMYYNSMRVVERNIHRIVRVSFYYVISKNSWFWDRVLFFTKDLEKNGTRLHQTVVRFLSATDANKRFVYSHVCSQTQWLLFRAERPRDKSAVQARSSFTPHGEKGDPLSIGGCLAEIAKAISAI